ncbi:MAG: autotransporter domain-containing protein [Pseudolabrys sp.]|nr:autotransporter domain-containing protein [Pseudolabrys sp.]
MKNLVRSVAGAKRRHALVSRLHSLFGIAGLALSTLAILPLGIVPARAVSLNDGAVPPGGMSGYHDQDNKFPFVASILVNGSSTCTGTLINSRTILTAAHCFADSNGFNGGPTPGSPGNPMRTVSFKPIASANDFANNDRAVTSIKNHAQYTGSAAYDIAVISLSAPVTTITAVTLATPDTPVPAKGTTITMVGYGNYGTGSACCNPADNKRRVAESALGGLLTYNTVFSGAVTDALYVAQFRNPLDPTSPNRFGHTVPTRPLEGTVASGDSGGPLFVTIDGKFVQIGELEGGSNPVGRTGEYGDTNAWTNVAAYTNWLAVNNPLRTVSAKAGNHEWTNADAWQDSVPGVVTAAPNNTFGNVGNYELDTARYYNVTLANQGILSLDTSVTIDNLAITGAQSQLTLLAGYTLTTETSTTISNGRLLLSGGTLASPAVGLTGGFLTGAGNVNGNVTNNGGTIAPLGNIIVQGNLTQTAGTVQNRVAANSSNDLLVVTGTASLGGRFNADVQAGLYNATTNYTVLAAGAMSGGFANVTSSSPFFTAVANYAPNAVTVNLNRIGFGAVAGLNANQQAVGNALERGYSTGVTGNAATLYANLLAAQSTNVLTQVSGASSGVSQTVALTGGSMFMSSMMDQAAAWRDGDNTSAPSAAPLGYAAAPAKKGTDAFAALEPRRRAAPARVWQAYGSGFGGWQSLNADANGVGSSQHVGGGAIGFNYQASPDLLIGLSAGVGSSNFSSGSSSGDATTGQIGIYGIRTFNNLYVAGALNYGFGKTNTSRLIAGLGPTETARGSFHSDQLGGRIEVGHRYVVNGYGITPFAAIQASTVWQDGYTETSVTSTGAPGVFGLTYGSQTTTSLPTFLGVQVDNRVAIGSALWTPSLRAAWVHEFRPQTQVSAAFNAIPGSGFTVEGPRAAENALRLELGSTVAFNDRYSLFGKVTAEVSDRSQSFTGNGGVKVAW